MPSANPLASPLASTASAQQPRDAPSSPEEPRLAAVHGRWRTVATLPRNLAFAAAVTLADGRLLVTGGQSYDPAARDIVLLAEALLVDPATAQVELAHPMTVPRKQHTATRLADGRVLVVGGTAEFPWHTARMRSLSDAEIFDPRDGRWTRAAPLHQSRSDHVAVPLSDARVLVCAGRHDTSDAMVGSCEAYDPSRDAWTELPGPGRPRGYGTWTELRDHRWLLVGGNQYGIGPMRDTDVFDPLANRWTPRAPLAHERWSHHAVSLRDGRVLVVGGGGYASDNPTTAIYDPARDSWRDAAPPPDVREDPAVALLADGRVLFAGGAVHPGATLVPASGASAYDPTTDSWSEIAGPPSPLRLAPTVLRGHDGALLFVATNERSVLAFD